MKNLAKTTLILATGVTSTLHSLTQKRELDEEKGKQYTLNVWLRGKQFCFLESRDVFETKCFVILDFP